LPDSHELRVRNFNHSFEHAMTIKLCGFSASNYYNKIKLQLLEKVVPFEEELVWVGNSEAALLKRSPLGKVPFLDTPQASHFGIHGLRRIYRSRVSPEPLAAG
jgi:glutathione S-transferase